MLRILLTILTIALLAVSTQSVLARGGDDTGADDSGSSGSSGSSSDDSSGRNRTFDDNPSASDLLPDDSRNRSIDNSSGSNSGPGSVSSGRNFEIRVQPRVVAPGVTRQLEIIRSRDTREVEFRGRDGEVEIEIEDISGQSRSISDDGQKVVLRFMTSGGEREVEFEGEGGNLRFSNDGVNAISRFPITLDQSGQLFVRTGNGLKPLRILPDQAAQIAREKGLVTKINGVEVEFEDGNDDAVFNVRGQKLRRILGLISVNNDTEIKISADKGTVLSSGKQPWWSFLAF